MRDGLNALWPITIRYLHEPCRGSPALPRSNARRSTRVPARPCWGSCAALRRPVPEADIERESQTLDEAIARLEGRDRRSRCAEACSAAHRHPFHPQLCQPGPPSFTPPPVPARPPLVPPPPFLRPAPSPPPAFQPPPGRLPPAAPSPASDKPIHRRTVESSRRTAPRVEPLRLSRQRPRPSSRLTRPVDRIAAARDSDGVARPAAKPAVHR